LEGAKIGVSTKMPMVLQIERAFITVAVFSHHIRVVSGEKRTVESLPGGGGLEGGLQ
jgi:hypothetical protein